MAIDLLVTDENLAIVGDPLGTWTNLDCTRRFNEPASGSLEIPARPEVMAQLAAGHRLVVIRDGTIWMAGPMEVPQDYSWGIDGEGDADPGKVTVNFSDDLAVVAGYITWADPAVAWSSQPSAASRAIPNTNGEIVIRTLVDENCGPSALAARQIPNFDLDTVASVGTTTSVTTRFEPLLGCCRRVAIDSGGIGFRTRQTGSQILFETYEPRDLTATARFSEGLGNLRAVQYKLSAPTVTHALVAGTEPEAAARTYVEAADSAAASAWWRVEKYVDGPTEDNTTGELTAAGGEELAEGSAPVELATVTVDTEDLRAGVDFDLGDQVTVELPTGVEVADVVRSIHLQATPNAGEHVTTLVGSPEATSDPRMVRVVRELSRRLGRLEAR